MDISPDDYADIDVHWRTFPELYPCAQFSQEEKQALLADMIADREETPRSCYRMIVRHKDDGHYIGNINVWKVEGHHFKPELGISINPEWQGQGMGAEIYRGLIGFAFDKFPSEDLVYAEINPENIPTVRLHFNCGMQPFCFKKDNYQNGSVMEDELSMRLSRAHFEQFGARKSALSLK